MLYGQLAQMSSMTLILLFMCNIFIVNVYSNPAPRPFEFPQEISFPNDETDDVRKCLEQDYSMPFFSQTTGQVECHQLLTQGPCGSDEWFVLSYDANEKDDDLPQAICKKQVCDPIGNVQRVVFNGTCTNVTSSTECESTNMAILVNPFGEGECGCKERFIEWVSPEAINLSGNRQCYQEYLQGPCESGQQLVPNENEESIISENKLPPSAVIFGFSQILSNDEDDIDVAESICEESDCDKEGFLRLKTGECVEPNSCPVESILVSSTEFSKKGTSKEVKFQNEETNNLTCCLSDSELAIVNKVLSQDNNAVENVCDTIKISSRSALVTIPESCPRGQTITHDGECKHVRIWRSRPRRSSNRNNRIRQMMRYVRALRRPSPTSG